MRRLKRTLIHAVLAFAAMLAGLACGDDPVSASERFEFLPTPGDSVFIGRSMNLASVSSVDGAFVTSAPFEWRSSDTNVAVVSDQGTIFGIGPGTATITAELFGQRSSKHVRVIPIMPSSQERFSVASRGGNCAITHAGTLFCGKAGPFDSVGDYEALYASISFASFAWGGQKCGLTPAGQLYCRGFNENGEAFTGSASPLISEPVAGGGAMRFSALAVGGATCAISKADSLVYCAGRSDNGITGRPLGTPGADILPVPGNIKARDVSVGFTTSCLLGVDRRIYCWGWNRDGTLGTSDASVFLQPVVKVGTGTYAAVRVYRQACAITVAGELECWGYNGGGELGRGYADTFIHPEAQRIDLGAPIADVVVESGSTCALTVPGDVWCWGTFPVAEAAFERYFATQYKPVRMTYGLKFRSISGGVTRVCGVTQENRLVCL